MPSRCSHYMYCRCCRTVNRHCLPITVLLCQPLSLPLPLPSHRPSLSITGAVALLSPSPLSLLLPLLLSPPPPPPTFADPIVGWLLRCCPPSAFVIAFCRATCQGSFCRPLLHPIVIHRPCRCHRRHYRSCRCRRAATTGTINNQHRGLNHRRTLTKKRGSSSTTTSVPTAAPLGKRLQVQTTWPYLTSTVFDICDVCQVKLAISKLLLA